MKVRQGTSLDIPTTPNTNNQQMSSGPWTPNNDPNYDPLETFKKFKTRTEKQRTAQTVLDEMNHFSYNPKRFFCQRHKDTEIEYCCKINETFYCRLCVPNHKGHDDLVLADVCQQVQQDVIKLKHSYIARKQQMINKLDIH